MDSCFCYRISIKMLFCFDDGYIHVYKQFLILSMCGINEKYQVTVTRNNLVCSNSICQSVFAGCLLELC